MVLLTKSMARAVRQAAGGNIDGHPVGIGELELPLFALCQQFQPNVALRPSRLRRKSRVPLDQRLKILLERIDILHFETQVVHMTRFDPGPFVVVYRPGRHHQGHSAIGEIMTGVVARFL